MSNANNVFSFMMYAHMNSDGCINWAKWAKTFDLNKLLNNKMPIPIS